MSEPNFRMLVRNLRLMDEAKKANKCHACGRKLPKEKASKAIASEQSGTRKLKGDL